MKIIPAILGAAILLSPVPSYALFKIDEATAPNQLKQFALDKAHQAKEIAEQIKQTKSMIESLDPRNAERMLRELLSLEGTLDRNSEWMEEVYSDPDGFGSSTAKEAEFRRKQSERALDRLDKLHKETEEAAEREKAISRASANAVRGSRTGGMLGAQQATVDATAAGTAAIQENTAAVNRQTAMQAAEIAKQEESRRLTKEKICTFWENCE